METTLSNTDIILMIMQYLKGSSLNETFAILQRETDVPYNLVRSHEELRTLVLEGQWDKLLSALKDVSLLPGTYAFLYDQLICELCESQEFDLAGFLLKQHAQEIIDSDKARYSQLLGIIKNKMLPPGGLEASKRRPRLAEEICKNTIETSSASRLIDLLQAGLHKQPEREKDLQRTPVEVAGTTNSVQLPEPAPQIELVPQEEEAKIMPQSVMPYIQVLAHQRRTKEKYHLKVAKFAHDGSCIATGSADGFIEILESTTLQLRTDLTYQTEKKFMLHEKRVLCLEFSSDSKMLCSGDESGLIKVWKISDGKCLRRLEHAHDKGVTCCKFMSANSQIISGSFSWQIRVHGLKSGALLREFPGHSSYVTDILLLDQETTLMSSSSDGTIKLWDTKSGILRQSFMPGGIQKEVSVNSVIKSPGEEELFAVCNRSPVIYIINRKGEAVIKLNTEKPKQGEFVAVAYSEDGRWIYAAAQDLNLYVFDAKSGELCSTLRAHGKEVIGMSHHPNVPLLITFAADGYLFLWKP